MSRCSCLMPGSISLVPRYTSLYAETSSLYAGNEPILAGIKPVHVLAHIRDKACFLQYL